MAPTPKPPRAQISYCSEHLLSSSQQIEERRRGGGNQRRKQEARREKKYSRAKQRGKRLEAPSTPLKHCSSPHRPPLSPTPPTLQCWPTNTFSHMASIKKNKNKNCYLSQTLHSNVPDAARERCIQHPLVFVIAIYNPPLLSEVGSNEVQIHCYCTSVDFSVICTRLHYFFF